MKQWFLIFSAVLAAGLVLAAVQWGRKAQAEERARSEREWQRAAARFVEEIDACLAEKINESTAARVGGMAAAGRKLLAAKLSDVYLEPVERGVARLQDNAAFLRSIDWPAVRKWEAEVRAIVPQLQAAMTDEKNWNVERLAAIKAAHARGAELLRVMPAGTSPTLMGEINGEIARAIKVFEK